MIFFMLKIYISNVAEMQRVCIESPFKYMSNCADPDDKIKCLPEGDSHSLRTIKLDERL